MSEVPSTFELSIGQRAPEFELPTAAGDIKQLASLKGEKGTLIVFACNHCPYVIHLASELGALAAQYQSLGVNTVAISSNDVENYPQDSPEKMVEFAKQYGWNFPYLYDETQEVAHAYSAACTPDFFLLDAEGCVYYAGQFDASRPKNQGTVDGADMRSALEALLNGQPAPKGLPATGCNIKWKPGNAPSYFG